MRTIDHYSVCFVLVSLCLVYIEFIWGSISDKRELSAGPVKSFTFIYNQLQYKCGLKSKSDDDDEDDDDDYAMMFNLT